MKPENDAKGQSQMAGNQQQKQTEIRRRGLTDAEREIIAKLYIAGLEIRAHFMRNRRIGETWRHTRGIRRAA